MTPVAGSTAAIATRPLRAAIEPPVPVSGVDTGAPNVPDATVAVRTQYAEPLRYSRCTRPAAAAISTGRVWKGCPSRGTSSGAPGARPVESRSWTRANSWPCSPSPTPRRMNATAPPPPPAATSGAKPGTDCSANVAPEAPYPRITTTSLFPPSRPDQATQVREPSTPTLTVKALLYSRIGLPKDRPPSVDRTRYGASPHSVVPGSQYPPMNATATVVPSTAITGRVAPPSLPLHWPAGAHVRPPSVLRR